MEARHLPIATRRLRYGVRTGVRRREEEEELEQTCAVASPFALMASITGLLDGYRTSIKGVKKDSDDRIRTFARRLRLGPLRKDILRGSGSPEDLKEDWEGGDIDGCASEGERSKGKRSMKGVKVKVEGEGTTLGCHGQGL